MCPRKFYSFSVHPLNFCQFLAALLVASVWEGGGTTLPSALFISKTKQKL
jgi:hypothetical protein